MTLDEITQAGVNPALALLPAQMNSPEARAMLLAIGLQESRFEHRRQLGDGPARSFWQMEMGGGVKGVCKHTASRYWMKLLCDARGVVLDHAAVWHAIEFDDVLAAGAARLLLFTDPYKLPALSDPDAAWRLYERVWRPGKPHPETWPRYHTQAVQFVTRGA